MTKENIEQADTDPEVLEKPEEQDAADIADSETVEPAEEVGAEVQDSIEADEAEVDSNVDEESEVAVEEGGEVEVEPEDAELADSEEDFEAAEDEDDDVEESAETAEPAEPEEEFEATTESVIEAVLFASDESLTAARLADIVGTGAKQVREHVEALNEKYKANGNAFTIEQIAGGYQMMTLSPYNHWLKKLLRARSDSKLSPAALETLAIIAYRQPIIRADIEAIRGVGAGEVIRNLMYKGLVKIVGRAEILGRPMLYGTTKKFLEVFGLNSLKDLPKVEELKKPPT